MSTNTELEQANLIAKINSVKFYVEDFLNQLEEEFDRLEEDEEVSYDNSKLQFLKGSVSATETIKQFVEVM